MAKPNEPVQDAVKAYFELALGLTEASKKKAEKTVKKVAREVLGKSGATASQLQSMAEDVISTGAANREVVVKLVQAELERALGKVGLVKADEVAALTTRIDELERQLATATATAEPKSAPVEPSAAAIPVAAEKKVAKKAVAKKAVAKKSVAGSAASKAAAPSGSASPAAKATAPATSPSPASSTTTGPAAKTAVPAGESAPIGKAVPVAGKATAAKEASATATPVAAKKAVAKKTVAKKAATTGADSAGVVEPPAPVQAPVEQETAAPSNSVAPAVFSDADTDDVPPAAKKAPAKKAAKKAPARKANRS